MNAVKHSGGWGVPARRLAVALSAASPRFAAGFPLQSHTRLVHCAFSFFLIHCTTSAQNDITGQYAGYYGELALRPDSSFEYFMGICTCADHAFGTWSTSGDTLILTYVQVEDTYVSVDSVPSILDGKLHKVAVLRYRNAPSWDQKADTLRGEIPEVCRLNRDFRPYRLCAKKDRLYALSQSGKLMRSKAQTLYGKKVHTYFMRIDRSHLVSDTHT